MAACPSKSRTAAPFGRPTPILRVPARFNAFMTAKTREFVHDLLEHHNLSSAQHLVDVGGGSGALIAGLLQAAPATRGTVFDTESGLADTEQLLREYGVRDRCTLAAGSFFDRVPAGGDVYILRQILHDWPDDRAAEILAACRRSMRVGEQLLVIDQILPDMLTDDPAQSYAFEMDLHMFVLFGARERAESELTAMITERWLRRITYRPDPARANPRSHGGVKRAFEGFGRNSVCAWVL